MTEITCKCGAFYHETCHKVMMRDKDSAECGLCGETLKDWNGAEKSIPISWEKKSSVQAGS